MYEKGVKEIMALSRKDFERTAKIIKKSTVTESGNIKDTNCIVRRNLTEDFSNYFSEENPRFDKVRFKKASMGDC